jgi:hypothetical protein
MASPYEVLRDFTFTIERGTTYGALKDTSPKGIPTVEMKIGQEPTAHYIDRSWGVRAQSEASTWQNTSSNMPTASFAFPAVAEMLKYVIPSVCQKGTDWAAAANVYTMYPVQYSGLSSPKTDNSGYYYSLVANSQVTNKDEYIKSAVCKSLKMSIHPVDNESTLWCETEWVGDSYTRGAQVTGTPSHIALSGLYTYNTISGFNVGGNNMLTDLISAEINITYGAKTVRDLPNKEFVFPLFEANGNFVVQADAYTDAIINGIYSKDVNSATAVYLYWGNSTPSVAGDLRLDLRIYFTSVEIDRSEGSVLTLGWKGVLGTPDSTVPFKATFYAA